MRSALLALAVLAACSDDPEAPATVDLIDGGPCSGPTAGFCDAGCPSFAESVAEVKRLAAGPRCFIAESGACGPLQYTYHSTGFEGFEAWFDGQGVLVGARRFSDTPQFCANQSRTIEFGGQPACERAATARYCPQTPRSAASARVRAFSGMSSRK